MPECVKPRAGDVMFVDVGVYGHSELPGYIGKDAALRRFEQFTLDHDGFQELYAETLMTKDEFTRMFPREIYDRVCKTGKSSQIKSNPNFISGSQTISWNYSSLSGGLW